MKPVPDVLFVCTHNAGRSQLAAALLDHLAAGKVRVSSVGSQPASQLNLAVVVAMAEIGLDITREHPKLLDPAKVQAADVVITMGGGDTCPVYPRQALPRLGPPRPGRQDPRPSPAHPRRHRHPSPRPHH
jgi:arsenate reductase (thioredoxin)